MTRGNLCLADARALESGGLNESARVVAERILENGAGAGLGGLGGFEVLAVCADALTDTQGVVVGEQKRAADDHLGRLDRGARSGNRLAIVPDDDTALSAKATVALVEEEVGGG